jgi:hypothetical protein
VLGSSDALLRLLTISLMDELDPFLHKTLVNGLVNDPAASWMLRNARGALNDAWRGSM